MIWHYVDYLVDKINHLNTNEIMIHLRFPDICMYQFKLEKVILTNTIKIFNRSIEILRKQSSNSLVLFRSSRQVLSPVDEAV